MGAVFPRRKEVLEAKLHRTNQRGISWLVDQDGSKVGDAIVLNGGYDDDEDDWGQIRYTGASPSKDRAPDGTLIRDQSWSYEDNAALLLSYKRRYPIRVIRGYGGDERYSPGNCYRYDGLYEITEVRTATSKRPARDGSAVKICQFDLRRLPDQEQVQTSLERHVIDALAQLEDEGAEKIPQARTMQVRRLIRDTAAARRIKELYQGECQMCGLRLTRPDGKPYSEGAHIRPLGKPHHGPDVEPNILCLCPNCHVCLDMGGVVINDDWSITLRTELSGMTIRPKLTVKEGHRIHRDHLQYHRRFWEGRRGAGGAS